MKTSDFYYDLPQELIAQTPIPQRDASRLMTLDRATGKTEHRHFYELPDFLLPYKQHIAAIFEKVYNENRWEVCCDDNEFRRLCLLLVRIFLPMAAELFSPLPGTGRVLLRKKISESPPGWLSRLVYRLVNENRWQTHFAVSSG